MSIEKIYSTYNLVCDCCGETADETFDCFDEAVYYKKANGWRSQCWGDVWQDICPDCQNPE